MKSSASLLPRLFADAGNRLTPTPQGFKTAHEPVHVSASGSCVNIDAEKEIWHCFSCNQGGDAVSAVMSLRGLSREDARIYLRDTAGEEVPDTQSKRSQATALVALAKAATLWHTPDGDPWASFPVNEHTENTRPSRQRHFGAGWSGNTTRPTAARPVGRAYKTPLASWKHRLCTMAPRTPSMFA